MNALVLPGEEEEDVVVVDDKAISLIKLLKDEGAKPIGVTMPQQDHPDGKINCQTNTFNLDDNLTLNDLVEPLPRIKFKLGGKIFWI